MLDAIRWWTGLGWVRTYVRTYGGATWVEVGPGILSRSCIALEFDETFEGCSFVPEPRCILTCFRFVAARHRAEKSSASNAAWIRGRGEVGCRYLLSFRENIKLRLDDRVVLFRWIKKEERKRKEGTLFFNLRDRRRLLFYPIYRRRGILWDINDSRDSELYSMRDSWWTRNITMEELELF